MTDNTFILYNQLPHILRARGFRLYLTNGKRLIDLWLNGGAAVLGHTPPNLLRELKNSASRGLYAPFPHFTQQRFLKTLSKLLPEHNFRFYAAPPPEVVSLFNSGGAKLWRPYQDFANPFAVNNAPLIIPVLPGIQTWRNGLPFGLCVTAVKSDLDLPQNDALSPITLAIAARGAHDLLAAPERVKPVFQRINKMLHNSVWQRRGIYLNLKDHPAPETWQTLFNQFLEAGFLLPPDPSFPLILPGEISKGEEQKLASVLAI